MMMVVAVLIVMQGEQFYDDDDELHITDIHVVGRWCYLLMIVTYKDLCLVVGTFLYGDTVYTRVNSYHLSLCFNAKPMNVTIYLLYMFFRCIEDNLFTCCSQADVIWTTFECLCFGRLLSVYVLG